ncbi:mannosyl oligosaccharide 1,2-alpha-mannosidase [Scheffersomyces xylosifermentans]|uniref:mannosyl oligosaccharide 1,2-alpha-mannosidase n=1 Tax=Scheffersomyces xylosifermentans TaxID=1304137 RepID=UPI00315D0ADC
MSSIFPKGDNIGGGIWKAKSSNSLPMYYKDKPNYNAAKSGKAATYVKGLVVALVIYFLYSFGFGGISGPSFGGGDTWAKAQKEVRSAMLDSWHTYEKFGWGYDIYHPIRQQGENMGPKPLGWIIVDSLDTLILMDAKEEVARARKWIKEVLDYRFDYNVNVFETTIRMMGGLLSAFHFTEDDAYLDKAVDLANALDGSFNSKTGIPYSSVNLESGEGIKNHADQGASSTAEVATLQLEFKYLASLTGEVLYWQRVEKVMQALEGNKPEQGLVPIYVDPDTGKFQGNLIRLGSRGDSYYEYLLKQYLQTNQQEPIYRDMYRESVRGVKKNLLRRSYPNNLAFIGELENGIGKHLSPKMDHLVCFYGGLLALGATNGLTYEEAKKLPDWTAEKEEDFQLGADLTYTCYRMYADVETGLSPEIVVFNEDKTQHKDFHIKPADRHNLQRPETVESLFILYRLTGDEKYRKYGYEIFQNFIKYTKVVNKDGDIAFTSLRDVTVIPPKTKDNMESFWYAETLKYLYLLFDDTNLLPLDKYVFNTEAHPFPRFNLNDILKTGWRRKIEEKKEPTLQEPQIKIDKQNPPEAQPVDKSVEKAAAEVIKQNPKVAKEENIEENKQKMNDIIKQNPDIVAAKVEAKVEPVKEKKDTEKDSKPEVN